MKNIIIKYYAKINLILFVITLIFAIIPTFFNLSKIVEYNLYQIMILSFLLTEFCDIVVSDDTLILKIITLNYYSKIITPIFFVYNLTLLVLLNSQNYLSYEFIDYSSYLSFAYALLPTLIRVRYDKYYIYRLMKKK